MPGPVSDRESAGQVEGSGTDDRHGLEPADRRRIGPSRPGWRPWDVLVAYPALVGVYALISDELRIGPVWLLPVVVAVLLVPLAVAHERDRLREARLIGFMATGISTLAVLGSVSILFDRLVGGSVPAANLLRDSALLWVANVITFGLWYWELDGGGHHRRHLRGYEPTDLAFPQISIGKPFSDGWMPQFVDYLFVAFTVSAAFGPTDTSFLSVRVKLLLMVQTLASFIIVAVIASRAISILR